MPADTIIDVAEQKRLNEAREAGIPWKKWGPYLSERQWGTVREDYSTTATRGITSPTTSRVPGRIAGAKTGSADLRRQAAALLRAGAVERARPDPEGTPVRPDQQRRQPWRGRKGVLLLHRQHADPFVHEVPVQVPAAGVSVSRSGRDEPSARRARSSSTNCWTPASSTMTGISTFSSSTPKADPEDVLVRITVITADRKQPGFGCCRPCGSGTRGRGAMTEPKPLFAPRSRGVIRGRRTMNWATTGCTATAGRSFFSRKTKRNSQRLWNQPNASPYVKDAFHSYVVRGQQRMR